MKDRRKSILVIGGGVIGLCVAHYAAQRGHTVTIIDRGTPDGDRCSSGNAGMIVPSHFIPLAAPGMIAMGLSMMRNPRSPFYIKPRLSWELLTWGWNFWRAATASKVAQAAPVLRDLHLASLAAYQKLATEFANDFGLTQNGLLMLCKTEQTLHEEAEVAGRAVALGIPAEVLNRAQTAAKEPNINMDVAGAVFFPKDSHLTPQELINSLRARLEQSGIKFLWQTPLESWRFKGPRLTAAKTSQGDLEFDECVICAGVWSTPIARSLGLRLPMLAGKGYSLTLPAPAHLPKTCAILTEARVAVTPMGQTLRFGGTMELVGLDESTNPQRVEGIILSIPNYYPQFSPADFKAIPAWHGLRPCPPDGLPYI
ncbi:MAG TPA: FAD-dependent oxidoreductase, partial [Tepidisphaeraceae bacterium]